MKTFLLLSTAFIFSVANAQDKKITATPVPVPMTAPAMKTQNATQNSQNSSAPKASGTTTETKKADNGKAAESAPAPAVDNKIAVSDPGTPGDRGTNKKTAASQPADKKANSSGVSPK